MATTAITVPAKQPIWQTSEVPPFPAIAVKALNLMAGTDTSLLELCNLIRSDIAFSTEVLRVANSPLVAFSKDVTSVLQASMLLGFRRLQSLVITLGLKAYLAQPFSPLLQSCWRHSLACAIIAERAAKLCSLDKDFAYTAGIMHDIGRVALAVSMPGAYTRVVARAPDGPRDLLQTENELCGIDHCQAGRALVNAWELPRALSWITACHHDSDPAVTPVESIVSVSCLLADSLGFGVARYRNLPSYSQILGGFSEPVRSAFPANEPELASEVENEIKLIESV